MKKITAIVSVLLILCSLFTACSDKKDGGQTGSQDSLVSGNQTPSGDSTAPSSPSDTGSGSTGGSDASGGSSSTDTVGKSSSSDILPQLPASPDVVPAP